LKAEWRVDAGQAQHGAILRSSVEVGESTSQSVSALLATGHILPAIALARVRLEQVIVASYLVHADPQVGLARYGAFAPIMNYRIGETVSREPSLKPHVSERLNMEELRAKALSAQQSIKPGFDIVDGKFESKWTSLDLWSMARKRDSLAAASDYMVSRVFELAGIYAALYRPASSVVHADGSSLVAPFRGLLDTTQATLGVSADVFWKLTLPVYLVTFDLIQCYEALRWSGVRCDDEFIKLAERMD
jgi:hypothetical protein